MLYSLADEGHAPKAFKRLTSRGIPLIALSVSMLGGLASLISSVVAPETVYLALVSVAGFAVVGVWMSITASHFFHRRAFVRNGGRVADLAYKAPFFPVVPLLAFGLCLLSLVGIALDPTQVTALYFGVPFVAACYLFFHFRYGRKAREHQTA
jgi:S-methylmethionine transporter